MYRSILASFAALVLAFALPAHAKQTAGDEMDDSAITAQVKTALFDHKDTHSTKINVETYRGIVQLSGFVSTEAEKATAAKVAEGIKGVKEVRNSIALHPDTSVGTKLDDTVLTSKVKAALMDSADVKSGQINVETEGGIVQLSGFVTGEGMKERAGKVAAGISGVKSVDNVLIVKPK
jgi:hyperosmotically inducible protein